MAAQSLDTHLTWASERHLRINLAAATFKDNAETVHLALAAIKRARLPGLVSMTPAASTILLEFDPDQLDETQAADAVRKALQAAREQAAQSDSPIIEIPVCYEPPCAPDAEDVARYHGIDLATLIRMHTKPVYTVQFIGFAPGFGYLSGLPTELATPRLDTPRVRVPAGSVGIAGDQTGIYPTATAGGWRLIGRTPLTMFDAGRERPSLLSARDRVRFIPIEYADFESRLRGLPDNA